MVQVTNLNPHVNNPGLTSSDIGKAIGRSRQSVDDYIADLRAAIHLELDLKIFRMNRLGISQERIAKRLGVDQKTIHNHLGKKPGLAILLNADLSRGFTIHQVAEKHMQKKRILGVTSRYVIVLK
ncbi:MAG: HTH domain protein [Candidatus Scalindua rubra]|uniref:HTH domain protein n=1 Tax=Candidatus Scalindua rubra TaxID=1872076 RepID=A0A1E3X924_9BACT|nr:MAG: HTH domain protein [Candidatus Scalindua rubra]